MSKVEYDLDTSGGLMDKIQALIAPPGSEDKKDKDKQDHPYFRKPGKGHNRDCCDACGEGGDLICCDKCPSSFHLLCYDPPLEQKDIPVGEWMCHTCQYNAEQTKPSTSSSSNSKPPQTRSKRTLSTPEMSTTKPNKKSKSNPLEVLIEAARSLNPKQFELPRSLSVPCIFPGTDKASKPPFSSTSRRNLKLFRKQSISSQGSNNTLPLGKCFECRKSCRVAPLLACDFCLLMFHLDCLDPPLASPPQGRWMCPNHVEHALDSKLLTSISATERVTLWDKFTGPVDQDSIKLEFFRTVNRHNPPFRTKVKLGPRNRVSVPPMVYYHYQNRVELLPSLRDVLRHEKMVQREVENLKYNSDVEITEESNMEVLSCKSDSALDDFLVGKSGSSYEDINADECMDVDVKRNGIFEFSTKRTKVVEEVLKGSKDDDLDFKTCDNLISGALSDDGSCKIVKGKSRKTKKSKKMSFNSSIKDISNVQKTEKLVCNFDSGLANGLLTSELDRNSYTQNGVHNNTDFIKREDHYLSMSSNVSEEVDNQLNQLDERLLKLLAYQRIQELLTQSDPANSYFTAFFSNSAQSKFFNVPLPSELLTPEDIERISRIFGNNAKRIIQKPKSNFRVRAMFCPVVSKHFYNIRTSEVNASHVRHDGSFMGYRPTVSARFPEAVAMRYRIMSIGIGPANDLQLERFGHCNFISPKHAVIFHDETTQQFEMLNYSCYGTYVNNVLYSNNETIKHTKKDDKKGGNLECQVREIIDKRRQINKKNANNEKMALVDSLDRMECSCTSNNNDTLSSGWEGSAIINHGSLLRFGCICFVFSYVDCATT